jgi:hypothetical protein
MQNIAHLDSARIAAAYSRPGRIQFVAGIPTSRAYNLLPIDDKLVRFFFKALPAIATFLSFNRDDFRGHARTL